MRPLLRTAWLALLLGACSGEIPADDEPAEVDFPLDSADTVRQGAPSNEVLPSEGKADEVYPAAFDLVATQSPVRNQASRGVCSIFATTALMEHLYLAEGTLPSPDFSEQFLQWSTKAEAGEFTTSGGSSANVNIDTLARFGTVFESDWPYETSPWGASNDSRCGLPEAERPIVCHTNGDPPAAALAAQRWHIPRGRWINSRPESLKAHMYKTKTAVQIGGDFYYQAWGHGGSKIPVYRGYRNQGYIVTPNQADVTSSKEHRAGHSVLLVGWDDNLEVQAIAADGTLAVDAAGKPVMQKGFFLFKNSWGSSWATANPKGAGYGWISYDYVSRYMSAYASGLPELELAEVCSDGRDNDYNGQTDCADTACASDRACLDPVDSYSDSSGGLIPDNTPAGLSRTLNVSGEGDVTSLQVSVDITHAYVGDLTVVLAKGTTRVTLYNREGGGADNLKKTWDVADFNGLAAAGAWTLQVIDGGAADAGKLNSWSLTLTRCVGADCEATPTTLSGASSTPLAIPDGVPAGVTSAIAVSGKGNVAALRVTVNISHPFLADLVISVSKDGSAPVELLRDNYVEDTVLTRTFSVDAFNGQPAAGSWELHVADIASGDQGTLTSWSVDITVQ